jgi:hypothetical protein
MGLMMSSVLGKGRDFSFVICCMQTKEQLSVELDFQIKSQSLL